MEFRAKTGDLAKIRSQCILVAIYEKNKLSPAASLLDKASGGQITKVLKHGDISGKTGQTLLLHDLNGIAATRVLLVGFGNSDNLDPTRFVQALRSAINLLKSTSVTHALGCLHEVKLDNKDTYWKARRLIEVFEESVYAFTAMKGKSDASSKNNNKGKTNLTRVDLQIDDKKDLNPAKKAILHGTAISKGIKASKDLANTPGNICTPTYIANACKKLAKNCDSISTSVLEEKDMKRLGMGALLSVSQGSAEPAKLVVMKHNGAKATKKPYVLVGKGISFDSGGISLKPGAGMGEMIYDMCGAASVLGVMTTVAELNLPINIIGVITSAENMPSGTASRPGDIVTSMSGQTIEILNTDAEGRLVLCDALTYIDKFKPETVIDIATLTGACVIALGSHATALYANDDDLAQDISDGGEESMDRVWRMPLWEEYQKQIDSNFADMSNVGGREAGSVTAACFLSRFTKKYRWAHLDIAGTGWKTGNNKAATGRPVTLLSQYLLNR